VKRSEKIALAFAAVFSAAVISFVTIGILKTLPVSNVIEGNELVTTFAFHNQKVTDIEGVTFLPVPDEATHNLIRTNGTSLGKKHSGHFKNTKTGTHFIFYVTGKGEKTMFVKDGVNYIVDL